MDRGANVVAITSSGSQLHEQCYSNNVWAKSFIAYKPGTVFTTLNFTNCPKKLAGKTFQAGKAFHRGLLDPFISYEENEVL